MRSLDSSNLELTMWNNTDDEKVGFGKYHRFKKRDWC